MSRHIASPNPRQSGRYGVLAIFAVIVASSAPSALAQGADRSVVLETEDVQRGEAFACRIPVQVRYKGDVPLGSIRIIAKALDGNQELASTGVSSGSAIIPRKAGKVVRYEPVPMQFDLVEDTCDRIDGLRIEFATCVFGELPAENCLDQVQFEKAPTNRPRYLAVKPGRAGHK